MILTKGSILTYAINGLDEIVRKKLVKMDDKNFIDLLSQHGVCAYKINQHMYKVMPNSKNY